MKTMKVQALAAMLLAVVLMIALTTAASAVEEGVKYQVDGSSLPIGELVPPTYEQLGNGDVSGVATPIILSCPGPVAASTAGVTCASAPYDPFGPNGWEGQFIAAETVLRQLSSIDSPPPFSSTVDMHFSGHVIVGGQKLFGTMVLSQTVTGVLNEPVGVDCYATPEDPLCGAANYTGEWRIVPGSGTDELGGISGSGTTEWKGCTLTGTAVFCKVPTYQGEIEFANMTGLYLPMIMK